MRISVAVRQEKNIRKLLYVPIYKKKVISCYTCRGIKFHFNYLGIQFEIKKKDKESKK